MNPGPQTGPLAWGSNRTGKREQGARGPQHNSVRSPCNERVTVHAVPVMDEQVAKSQAAKACDRSIRAACLPVTGFTRLSEARQYDGIFKTLNSANIRARFLSADTRSVLTLGVGSDGQQVLFKTLATGGPDVGIRCTREVRVRKVILSSTAALCQRIGCKTQGLQFADTGRAQFGWQTCQYCAQER